MTRERSFFRDWEPVREIGKDIEASVRSSQKVGAIPKIPWGTALRVVQKLDDYDNASCIDGIAVLNGCTLTDRLGLLPGRHRDRPGETQHCDSAFLTEIVDRRLGE